MNIPKSEYTDYPAIHDVLFDVYGKSFSNQEIDTIIESLPNDLQLEGVRWGWGDTVFRDGVFEHLKKELTKRKTSD